MIERLHSWPAIAIPITAKRPLVPPARQCSGFWCIVVTLGLVAASLGPGTALAEESGPVAEGGLSVEASTTPEAKAVRNPTPDGPTTLVDTKAPPDGPPSTGPTPSESTAGAASTPTVPDLNSSSAATATNDVGSPEDVLSGPSVGAPTSNASVQMAIGPEESETFGMPEDDPKHITSNTPVAYEKIQYIPGKGVEFLSVDERHRIQMRLRAQMRYTLSQKDDSPPEHSFQIRRARLQFKGNFFGKHNKYKFELAVSPRDIGLDRDDGSISKSPLLDWYFDFDYLKSLTIRVGQQKIPYSRQRVISSGNLQLVDRSIANREFTLDRDIGIDARSKDFLEMGWLRYYLGVYMGEGHSSFEAGDFGMNYLARVELLPIGMFEDYSEADHQRLRKPRLGLGTTYAFLDEGKRIRGITGRRPEDGGTTDYHNVEVDLMFKWAGWSVLAEAFYRSGTRNPGLLADETGAPILGEDGQPISVELPRNGFGYVIQSGLLVPRTQLEVAGRYAHVDGLGVRTSLTREDEVGGGLSYYFARHPFKIQADYFRVDDGFYDRGDQMFRLQLQGAF